MAGAARDLPAHRHDEFGVGRPRVDCHVADALARQAQRLRPGVAGQRVVVELGRIRLRAAVEHDLAVGLVADQEDVVTVFSLLRPQDTREPVERFGRIHRAGGIVRRVDEHDRHLGVQRRLERREVDLETLDVGGHDGQPCARAFDIRMVFGEVWREREHFVAGLGDGPQRVGERTGGTRRREDVAGRVIHAETPVEAFGDGAARLRVAQRRAVSVERDRIGGLVHVDHRLGEAGRARHARVAQRIVEHVVVSDFGAPCGRVFTQGSNDRFAAEHGFVCFVDHGTTSPLDSGFVFTTDHAQQGMSPVVVGFARVGNRVY